MVDAVTAAIKHFLEDKGIRLIEAQNPEDTFLPGLKLGPGCIYVDYEKLSHPGDLLHEAGHLAVATPENREKSGTSEQLSDWPDAGEEMAAILWSYAAALETGTSLDVLFHSDGYKGESEWLKRSFAEGSYIGLPMLEWLGMAFGPQLAAEKNVAPFPHMVKWLRD